MACPDEPTRQERLLLMLSPARRVALWMVVPCSVAGVLPAGTQEPPQPRKIAVFGSSVAHGSGDHGGGGGYAGRLGALLDSRGWEVVNVSRGGDNTVTIAPRFETDLVPQGAGHVLIGLSLANEGITRQEDQAYRNGIWARWRSGMLELVQRCREAGMKVVVGNCYAKGAFASDPELYAYTRRMNVEISRWDVPSVNFLGAIDDGAGAWVEHFYADDGHPNGAGHQEMFLAIVPSVFEALDAGKPVPHKAAGNRYAHVDGGASAQAPLSFTPDDAVHAFAVSFWVRPATNGVLAAIAGRDVVVRSEEYTRGKRSLRADMIEAGTLDIEATLEQRDGTIVYAAAGGAKASGALSGDATWRHVVLSHGCARGESQLYVDGQLAGAVAERFIPETFFLGGGATPQPVAEADVREWAVYRSSLNRDEVQFLYEGNLHQSSLEVYAPLADTSFAPGMTIENRAQSMSQIEVVSTGLTARTE